jgi:exopolysaccharide production protein ExoQ
LSSAQLYLAHRRPIWNYVLAWMLLAPLLYLAAYGAFSIDHADFNNAVAGEYGTLLAGRSKAVPMAEIAIFYGIIGIVCFAYFKSLVALCAKFPSLLALPVLAVASTVWSQDPLQSFLLGTLALAGTIFAFFLSVRFSPEEQQELFLFVGVAVVVISIGLALLVPSMGVMQLDGKGAWQGLFNHKNRCAMGMAFLLTSGLFFAAPTFLRKNLKWGFIVLSLFLIAMTQSRTGWIIVLLLLVFVPVIQLFSRVSGRERFLISIFLAVGSIVMAVVVAENFGAIVRILGKDPTLTGRVGIWRAVLSPIAKRPLLGYGYSAFWLGTKGESINVVLATGFRNLANAENGILQMWLELGVVGVSIFLYTLLQACRNAWFCLRHNAPNFVKWYSAIIFLEILALVDGGKFMFPSSLDWILYVISCIGLALQAKQIRDSESWSGSATEQSGHVAFAREASAGS